MEEVEMATKQLQRNDDHHEFNFKKTNCNGYSIFVRVSIVNGLTHVGVCQREANGLKAIQMDMEAWTNLVVGKGTTDHLMGFSTPTEPKRSLTAPGTPKRRKVPEPICYSTPKVPRIDTQKPQVLDLTEPEDGGLTAMQFKWMLRSSDDILLQEKGVWTFDEDFAVKAGETAKDEYISEERGTLQVILVTRKVGMPEDLYKSCYAFLIYSEINRMTEAHCEKCQNHWDSQMDNMGFYGHMAPLYDRAALYYEDAKKKH
jgi:hypothetical protein